jgi:magnesium chelatase family protein
MITVTNGATIYGVDAKLITIEVNIVQGTNLYVVGLPDNAIKESQHRIESVLKFIKCEMPRQRVIVNLAPADIRKVPPIDRLFADWWKYLSAQGSQ